MFPGAEFISPESLGRCMESTDGIHKWVEQTTVYDRVRLISSTVSQPRSVQHIADEACVCEVTAREYLDRLSDLNVLLKSEQDGTPVYSPDLLHTRMKTLRDLLENHTHEELLQLKQSYVLNSTTKTYPGESRSLWNIDCRWSPTQSTITRKTKARD
ncbi:uncharacterized protein BN903_20 [Halorubrum sp. AJ67]|nr:uncharacterized protein BN903_20 [Halorubrum sp. AJ67]